MDQHRNEAVDLRHYLAIVLRHRWLIATAMVLGITVALAISLSQTPQYTAETLVVGNSQDLSRMFQTNIEAVNAPQLRSATDIETFRSAEVAKLASEKLASEGKPSSLGSVEINVIGASGVFRTTATNPDPEQAAAIANALTSAFSDFQSHANVQRNANLAAQLQPRLDAAVAERERLRGDLDRAEEERLRLAQSGKGSVTMSGSSSLATQYEVAATNASELQRAIDELNVQANLQSQNYQVIQRAEPPKVPSSPKTRQDVFLGAVLGLLLGLGGAFLREALDDHVRSPDALEEIVAAPVMGLIPNFDEKRHRLLPLGRSHRRKASAIGLIGNRTAAADAFRRLRTNLQFTGLDQPLKTVGITSPNQDEGKSTITANLAASMAQDAQRVIVVTCDLRKPTLHKTFGTANDCGLSTLLTGKHTLDECLQPVQIEDTPTQVWFLPSGPTPPNPAEMLGSQRMRELLADLASRCDIVIVDLPPVLVVSDTCALAGALDGILLIARDGMTKQRGLASSVRSLTQAGGHIIGSIVNCVTRSKGPGYAYSYYGYYNYYSYYGYQDRSLGGGGSKPLRSAARRNGGRLTTLPSSNGEAAHPVAAAPGPDGGPGGTPLATP